MTDPKELNFVQKNKKKKKVDRWICPGWAGMDGGGMRG